jgi:hypothetical protein
MTDAFDDRRKTLEEGFFKKQNESLLRKMKESSERAASKEEIRQHTGIANEKLLDALAAMKLGAGATMVMSMLPVIEVAWADGVVTEKERAVLLEQSSSLGIKPGSDAFLFLAHWLDERPDPSWYKLWVEYIEGVCSKLSAEKKATFKAELLGRARHVAEASGGVLGLGWAVSAAEKKVLDRLAKAFD